jgi:hypothetical protein
MLSASYFRIADGPGAQAIFDLPDGSMLASITSIMVQFERVQNVKVECFYTQEKVAAIRQKSRQQAKNILHMIHPPGSFGEPEA